MADLSGKLRLSLSVVIQSKSVVKKYPRIRVIGSMKTKTAKVRGVPHLPATFQLSVLEREEC